MLSPRRIRRTVSPFALADQRSRALGAVSSSLITASWTCPRLSGAAYTVRRLGVSRALERSLVSMNLIESTFSGV